MFKKIICLIFVSFILAGPILAASSDVNIFLEVTGTTTPPTTTPPAVPTGPGGGGFPIIDQIGPKIFNFKISELDTASANLSWSTDKLGACELAWGKTAELEGGKLAEINFGLFHQTSLKNLQSNARYYYTIICYNTSKIYGPQLLGSFNTLAEPDFTAPANVFNLTAQGLDEKIILRWLNPAVADFAGVEIRRGDYYYPKNLLDGELVYKGKGELVDGQRQFTDTGLINGRKYYYSVFSFDINSNYSSGAVVYATPIAGPQATTTPVVLPPAVITLPPAVTEPAVVLPPAKIYQSGELIPEDNSVWQVKENLTASLEVSTPEAADQVAGILLQVSDNKNVWSYWLELNKIKKSYGTEIIVPASGIYNLTITAINGNNQPIAQLKGKLKAEGLICPIIPEKKAMDLSRLVVLLQTIIILLIILWFLIRKKTETRDKH